MDRSLQLFHDFARLDMNILVQPTVEIKTWWTTI